MARPRKPVAAVQSPAPKKVHFTKKLVLNQWLLSLFGVKDFRELAEPLRNQDLEGWDEQNISRFHHVIKAQFVNRPQLTDDMLLEYDQNIFRHTMQLNENRLRYGQEKIRWKYFQYLALLFTEIYLDHYFRDPQGLLSAVNQQIAAYNKDKPKAEQLSLLDEEAEAWPQLNKLAFWMATGSGKTLLMHVNILQYQHYLRLHNRQDQLNRIILLTPNEGLSQQHLREFMVSGIPAEIFDKNRITLFTRHFVQIIDIHKLKEESGEKTVAVDAFEGNNLVLVDEGHRGASSGDEGTWMVHRNKLCERGFSFEYSATFGQAVKNSQNLTDAYAKSILFDYSYRFFYTDGFGKEYEIFNLDHATEQNQLELYLTAALLTFVQQQLLYEERGAEFRPFQIERPLWVFVGGRVTKGLSETDASDILQILQFLARYLEDPKQSISHIRRLLTEGLVTADKRNLFEGSFSYLHDRGLSPETLYRESLRLLFNAPHGGSLRLENLKGVTGEIALRVGDNPPFGVINVGDEARLCRKCEEQGMEVTERQFVGSLFHTINNPDSTINLLIGAKKFTEGWNSWRVSCMGLMNVGRSEGAQIIQLFGRGVRLKGYGQSLKRSGYCQLPPDVSVPEYIQILETLSIFGIRADYMAQFQEFLDEEVGPKSKKVQLRIPVKVYLPSGVELKTIRLKPEIRGVRVGKDAFRKFGPHPLLEKPKPTTDPLMAHLQKNQVELNWYPKVRSMRSKGARGGEGEARPNVTHLRPEHIAFMDLDRLYFELERYKAEQGLHTLIITREGIRELLHDHNWYRLLIPEEELAFTRFDKVAMWEEIALALLKKYVNRFFANRQAKWEVNHLEYQPLSVDDPNFLVREKTGERYYTVTLEDDASDLVKQLEELTREIEAGRLSHWKKPGLEAMNFSQHLYQPLLFLTQKSVEITPAPLNEGEWHFVQALREYWNESPAVLKEMDLYMLRNQSRGRGMGFFEAGNFYPDFVLWLVGGGRQRIIFVDPKGIGRLGPHDAKIRFHKTIKEIERRLGDPNVQLESFILSRTPFAEVELSWETTEEELRLRHVLFQDKLGYVKTMLEMVLGSTNP